MGDLLRRRWPACCSWWAFVLVFPRVALAHPGGVTETLRPSPALASVCCSHWSGVLPPVSRCVTTRLVNTVLLSTVAERYLLHLGSLQRRRVTGSTMTPGSKRTLGNDAAAAAAAHRRRTMASQDTGGSTAAPFAPSSRVPPARSAPSGAGTPARGRAFSDADVDAIVTAFLVAQTRNGRTLTDADVDAVASVLVKRLEEGALSEARIKGGVVEPVAEAATTSVQEALAAFEARQPKPEDLAKLVSDPVIEEVKKGPPGAQKPLKYTEMSRGQIRAAIKEAVPPTAFRQAEQAVIKQRVLILASSPAARGDVLTHLVPPTAHGSANNVYVGANSYRITLGVMQVILTAAHASGDTPEVFRDWVRVVAEDQSQRHLSFVSVARGGRHYVRADGRISLCALIIYFLMHKGREGVYIRLLHPEATKPEAAAASGHDYYAFEASLVVCEGGIFVDGGEQRTATKVVRGCLIQRARTVFYEFAKDKEFPAPVLAAVAETLRIMIQDVDFDWQAKSLPDHVGSITSGPRAWRLLLPRTDTRIKADRELESATIAEMELLDEVDDDAVDAAAVAADSAFSFGDDDFGIMPM